MINIENINSSDTKIGILGAGKSGIAASKLASYLGFDVLLSDSNNDIDKISINGVQFESGRHSKKILGCNFIIKSPGIPNDSIIIKNINKKKIPIVSEIEFASWFSTSPIIGVTGTNGKTTTVNLIHKIFCDAGFNSMVGGNIGVPFSDNVYKEISAKDHNGIHILELSSFQLEHITHLSLEVACILNISEDHLDRYNHFNQYIEAKLNILKTVGDSGKIIYNEDDKILNKRMINNNNVIPFRSDDIKNNNLKLDTIPLKGSHNHSNISAALAIAKIYNIDANISKHVIAKFNPLPHRLEYLLTFNHTRIYNDSKATNLDSMMAAIDTFNDNIIMIIGGIDKGKTDFYQALKKYSDKIIFIACYGQSGESIFNQLKNHIKSSYSKDFSEAVSNAISQCKGDDILLFSPGCASYDQFNSYVERGDKFKEIIYGLS